MYTLLLVCIRFCIVLEKCVFFFLFYQHLFKITCFFLIAFSRPLCTETLFFLMSFLFILGITCKFDSSFVYFLFCSVNVVEFFSLLKPRKPNKITNKQEISLSIMSIMRNIQIIQFV